MDSKKKDKLAINRYLKKLQAEKNKEIKRYRKSIQYRIKNPVSGL